MRSPIYMVALLSAVVLVSSLGSDSIARESPTTVSTSKPSVDEIAGTYTRMTTQPG